MDIVLIILAVIALLMGNSYVILGYQMMELIRVDAITAVACGIFLSGFVLVLSIVSIVRNKKRGKKIVKSVIALGISAIAIISPLLTLLFFITSFT